MFYKLGSKFQIGESITVKFQDTRYSKISFTDLN